MYWRPKKAEHLSGTVQNPSSKFPPCPRDGLSHPLIVYCFRKRSCCQSPVASQLSGLFLLLLAEPVLQEAADSLWEACICCSSPCPCILSRGGGVEGTVPATGVSSLMRPPASTGLAALPHILTFWLKPPWGVLAVWGDHRCMIWWGDSQSLASTLRTFLSPTPLSC